MQTKRKRKREIYVSLAGCGKPKLPETSCFVRTCLCFTHPARILFRDLRINPLRFHFTTHTPFRSLDAQHCSRVNFATYASIPCGGWLGMAGSIRLAAVYSGFLVERASSRRAPEAPAAPESPKEPLRAAGSVAAVGAATSAWPMAAGQSPPRRQGRCDAKDHREATPGRVSRLARADPWLEGHWAFSAFRAALPWTALAANCYKNLQPASPSCTFVLSALMRS